MKRYWDASALVDAIHEARLEKLVLEPNQWTRSHTLAVLGVPATGLEPVSG